MKKLLVSTIAALALLCGRASASSDGTYIYLCHQGHHKSSPITLDVVKNTITWHGRTFRNVTQGTGCRAEFIGSADGVTVDLCTATQGDADLKVGSVKYQCQMPRR